MNATNLRLPSRRAAFTFTELVVVLAVIGFLAVAVAAKLARERVQTNRIRCVNHLKNLGLALRIWPAGKSMEFPWWVDGRNGGTAEYTADATQTWRHFAVLSNELPTPFSLACPADSRPQATAWHNSPGAPALANPFSDNSTLGYFLCLNADDQRPDTLLAGDRNLTLDGQTVAPSTRFVAGTNSVLGFTAAMHNQAGNVLFGDGSVQQVTSAGFAALWRIAATNITDKTTNVFLVP